jgi:hypothetical protein
MKLAKRAAYLASYPFLAAMGLAIGFGILAWEKRLLRERARQERERQEKQDRWLAGVEDDWPFHP